MKEFNEFDYKAKAKSNDEIRDMLEEKLPSFVNLCKVMIDRNLKLPMGKSLFFWLDDNTDENLIRDVFLSTSSDHDVNSFMALFLFGIWLGETGRASVRYGLQDEKENK